MSTEERDELFRLVMRYHDGELPEEERARVRSVLEMDAEARSWLEDMERMGDATWEFVRDAVQEEDFEEYWVTIDEGVRSPTEGLRRRKRARDREGGLGLWLRRHFGSWLAPVGGLAVAGAAAAVVLAVLLPGTGARKGEATESDWAGITAVDNTLEFGDIEGDDWAVSILAAGEDEPMIIWVDDLHAG